ncbi:MAG: hypothetical protein SPF89_11215 [Sphaerochaetaceae bacterium]|nr:hypothetical protein [Spirochaetales bacterium]MDY5500665.1 hypothetical protein [Sphaerochaetaceae bacterium]
MMHLAGDLRIVNEDVFDGQALGGLTGGKTGKALRTGEGGQNGTLCYKVTAAKAASIAEGKMLTVEILSGDTEDGMEMIAIKTIRGAKTFAKGELVLDFVLPPSSKEYTAVKLTCDDSAATGSVDAYLQYLAR